MISSQGKNRPKKPRASIDGISQRPSNRFAPGASIGNVQTTKREGSVTPNSEISDLDNFRRPDGFYASSQQEIVTRKTSETFVIDRKSTKPKKQKKDKKRGIFRRKKDKKPLTKKKKILRVLAFVLIILALIIGFLVVKGYITLNKILPGGGGAAALNENVDPSLLNGEGDGRVNILLLGRGGETQEDGPDLTDTIILASIDPIAKEAVLLSVPRDLYVPIGDFGSRKINEAFFWGKTNYLNNTENASVKDAEQQGLKLAEETVENVLGVPIHYHIMIDFTGFKRAVDNVGGVTVNAPKAVSENMLIDGQPFFLNVQPGWQDMDGLEALAYSRSRYTSARGDFDRSERQRIIITALKDKILSAGTFTNPQKISSLLDTFGSHLQTNFSVEDLQRLYAISSQIPSDKIRSLDLVTPPNQLIVSGNIPGAGSIQVPKAGVGNFKEIHYFVRNELRDSFLKNENANIVVLNGTTTAGLATEKGEELKSYGYTVSKVDNAPTRSYPQTIIVDMRSGAKRYTQSYLEKRFGVKAVTTLPDSNIIPGEADFVIILGQDQAN